MSRFSIVSSLAAFAATLALSAAIPGALAQDESAAPRAGRARATVDLTGYWVSIVTEDWRWRMVTPARGDYASVPLNPEGRHTADLWDPAKDTATGAACKSYGVGGIMRVPGRLHITWADDNTLKIDTDAGTQTRLLRFAGQPTAADQGWQGYSKADWLGRPEANGATRGGSLHVVTTKMRAGYLRKNGVPYSDKAIITEYFVKLPKEPNGSEWFAVNTIVEDPTYLNQPFITSTHFRKEADGAKWSPSPCVAE